MQSSEGNAYEDNWIIYIRSFHSLNQFWKLFVSEIIHYVFLSSLSLKSKHKYLSCRGVVGWHRTSTARVTYLFFLNLIISTIWKLN